MVGIAGDRDVQESVVVEDVESSSTVYVLVDSYTGAGDYELILTEHGG